jgi:hypothetical protein
MGGVGGMRPIGTWRVLAQALVLWLVGACVAFLPILYPSTEVLLKQGLRAFLTKEYKDVLIYALVLAGIGLVDAADFFLCLRQAHGVIAGLAFIVFLWMVFVFGYVAMYFGNSRISSDIPWDWPEVLLIVLLSAFLMKAAAVVGRFHREVGHV